MKHLIFGFWVVLVTTLSISAKDHEIDDLKNLPQTAKMGDAIKLKLESSGGLHQYKVVVNGKEIMGELISQKVNGKPVIGGGHHLYKIELAKTGKLNLEITKTSGGKDEPTKKFEIEVKDN